MPRALFTSPGCAVDGTESAQGGGLRAPVEIWVGCMDNPQIDELLVEEVARGEPAAWHRLIERYEGRLMAFARARIASHADAEDIVQEAFVGFLQSLGNYDPSRSLETYLFAILRYKISDLFKRRGSHPLTIIDDDAILDGAYAAGNRCVGGTDLCHSIQFDVADSSGIVSSIDDHGAMLDPGTLDEFGFSHSAHHQIRLFDDIGQVLGSGVTDGHSGMLIQQHQCHGFAQYGAAAHHHCVQSFQSDIIGFQYPHNTGRCGGSVSGFSHGHSAETVGGHSIHIFVYMNAVETGPLIDLSRHGMLKQNTMHIGIGV